MSTPKRKQTRRDLIIAAREIAGKLESALQDGNCESVLLSRPDATIVVGLLAAAAEALGREAGEA